MSRPKAGTFFYYNLYLYTDQLCYMKKIIKLSAITVTILLIVALVVLSFIANTLTNRFEKKYKPHTTAINITNDSISLERGKMLSSAFCTYCHGIDFGGEDIFTDKKVGVIYSTNITPGGVTRKFSDADWINVIRFGVKPDSTPVFIMPSEDYVMMSDYDLSCVIAYLRTVKASDKKWPANVNSLTFYGKLFIQTGRLGGELFAAEKLDGKEYIPTPAPALKETPEYGSYLVTLADCKYCHGPHLNGGIDTGTGAMRAPNITPGGRLGSWDTKQFLTTIRSGVTPYGKHLDPEFMPWPYLATLNDRELKAIFLFLKAQPGLKDPK